MKRILISVLKEDRQRAGVTKQDARDRVRWMQKHTIAHYQLWIGLP